MTNITFPFSHYIVHGNSMLPTLIPGQDVLCFNWAYLVFKPKRNDLVILNINGKKIIKRIQVSSGSEIFVLGDNKKASTDSRDFGTVKPSQIIGKVVLY